MSDCNRPSVLAGFLATLLLLLPAPAASQSVGGTVAIGFTAPATMHPGDMLRVKIYREPDLSGEYQVNERGVVTLPRLGEIPISSWPVDSLQPRLTRAFAEYLRTPTIETTVLRRITITGAVLKPNVYQVDPTVSVLDALAMAGGAAPDGVRNRIELQRGDERFIGSLDQRSQVAALRLQSGDQLFVPQKSWLTRNTWLVSTLIGGLVTFTTVMVAR